jgi:hypothetical protein
MSRARSGAAVARAGNRRGRHRNPRDHGLACHTRAAQRRRAHRRTVVGGRTGSAPRQLARQPQRGVYCGAVKIVVTGDPAGARYDHCVPCRNERSYRQWCEVCGGHLLTRHPQWGLVDVYAATIPSFPFTPELHVNYESTVLPMKDGLPKLNDFPTELGGSGETLPE